MRFHLTSLDRAKLVAKNLCRIVDLLHDIDLPQTASRNILASMLGYRDWNEMKAVTERHDTPPSPYDELLEPEDLRARLAAQAKALKTAFRIGEDAAARVVASCRATAHPAGPHRLFGPSSLPPPYTVEYRGHAGWLALTVAPLGDRSQFNIRDPFAVGEAEALIEMVSVYADFRGDSERFWIDRKASLLAGVMRALAWKRDRGEISLTAGAVRDHLGLGRILGLADPQKEPEMPPLIRFLIEDYCASLPGYRKNDGATQNPAALKQHGFLQSRLGDMLGMLDTVYGHTFLAPHDDVPVPERRMLVVMDPDSQSGKDAISRWNDEQARRIIRNTTTKVYMRVPTDAGPGEEEIPDVVKHDDIEYKVTKLNM